MQLHTLKRKHANKKTRVIGRGGKRGTYSGRGIKGQNARSGHKKRPELRDIIKKIPRLRGISVNGPQYQGTKPVVINLNVIEKHFAAGERVSPKTLQAKKIISSMKGFLPIVKILGTGEISKKLLFSDLTISGAALEKITKAGGKMESQAPLAPGRAAVAA